MSERKGHVPDANLYRYRNLMNVVAHLKRVGGMASGMNEYKDANALWALEAKYRRMAQEFRVTLPEEIKKEID